MIKVSPSILTADFANLQREIQSVSSAQMLHIDVMDGHFVPNISIGLPVVQSIRRVTDMFLDVHIMVSDPLFYGPLFAKAGADLVCFHAEAIGDLAEVARSIKAVDANKKVGVSVKPKTDISAVFDVLDMVDMVLVMAVEPGFGGQQFILEILPKIKALRARCDACGINMDIEVDGGINLETARLCVDAGANILVAGSYIFDAEDRTGAIGSLMKL